MWRDQCEHAVRPENRQHGFDFGGTHFAIGAEREDDEMRKVSGALLE